MSELNGDADRPRLRGPADFNAAYLGTPPWDIGRPQPAFLALAREGHLRGRVLDIGCGTGEHALMAAELGLSATGIDAAPRAIEKARCKAADRGLRVRCLVGDALALDGLGESFDTVLDCGLFHVFTDQERLRYLSSLRAVTSAGSQYHLLCFSDRVPGTLGPRRIRREEIIACFGADWAIDELRPAVIDVTVEPASIPAWYARMTRT